MSETRIQTAAIIGTAGRREDGYKLNGKVYRAMYRVALDQVISWDRPSLVSGGAAWADHLAVSLFLANEVPGLTLWLPCHFDSAAHAFLDRKGGGEAGLTAFSVESVANYYHARFSRKLGAKAHASREGITRAIEKGAVVKVKYGFHSRNLEVARMADAVLAFTYGDDPGAPKDGGTKHTWDHSGASVKVHVPIGTI